MRTRTMARVLVLGGGYAGMLAAARVARHGNAQITLVDQRPGFVQRIRLHEALAGATPPGLAYGPALARRGGRFVQARVLGIDPARQEVSIAADGAERRLGYDALIVALGSASVPAAPGVAEYALRLNDPAAKAAATKSPARKAPPKKAATKKAATKKAPAKKAPARKAAAKKAPAKKAAAKKAAAKKAPAKKAAKKKAPAKKAAAKKSAKRPSSKKPAAKKAAKKAAATPAAPAAPAPAKTTLNPAAAWPFPTGNKP